jgi:hypothetical protein
MHGVAGKRLFGGHSVNQGKTVPGVHEGMGVGKLREDPAAEQNQTFFGDLNLDARIGQVIGG